MARDALIELRDCRQENVSFRVDRKERWADTGARWRFLDDQVTSRTYEQQPDRMRSDAAARFDTLPRGTGHPLLAVIDLREHPLPPVIDELTRLSESDDEHLSHVDYSAYSPPAAAGSRAPRA